MIQIAGLTKSFGSVEALKQISLELTGEKVHSLVGSSGSGKTTLLRAILRIVPYDEGKILIHGQEVAQMSPLERVSRIGYVPQNSILFPHLTCRENISIVGRSVGWSRADTDSRIIELLEIVPLEVDLLRRFPNELSGGQKQRVALMRALFLNPDVLLMDEPFGALDPLIRADIQSEMKFLFQKMRKTVVLVTHDLGEASFLSDEVILMNDGMLIQQGPLIELVNSPKTLFVTEFLNAHRSFGRRESSQ